MVDVSVRESAISAVVGNGEWELGWDCKWRCEYRMGMEYGWELSVRCWDLETCEVLMSVFLIPALRLSYFCEGSWGVRGWMVACLMIGMLRSQTQLLFDHEVLDCTICLA